MKDRIRERVRAVIPELIGVAILGILMATVVEALSPENLLRKDSESFASTGGPETSQIGAISQPA